ncbi:ABC transporter ATP-binding protein [Bacillus mojavensis]|uniref:ABC transporter ATP-binding protein n=1 Tax=Bacillus mojavensis TaxID=72360 RepID=A0AAP3CNA2_BACMO|nr:MULTISPECIES: ABC transporter ATP-binding protein [Bacillus]MCC2931385.1 ABC transporter ATP-binding protein [Bacillus sp. LBG-1-113]MCY8105460.1 ABC transporter ATP-binding protein [Bacillus mojavensis]MCY8481873.1 ABC transporter ATP-binding protein [Bacillus mojavensis]MCY8508260.1 ABC transporter ATP-binding protein [Bacillus mojavensis]MEC1776030.1 ABC transporter ATP-binding protein [Bacillus mojavensis]
MAEPILHIEGLDKKIGSKQILKQISMDVRQGEIIGLLGPNGSGKTTLIRIIVGLLKQNSGSVAINGFKHDTEFEQAMEAVGAIVENPEFYPYLSGWENLKHFANMHKKIDDDRLDEVVERVGLTSAIDDKVKTYSLGMRQRLGIAQAILHRPKLLILDEPTNGLDPAGMKDFRDHIKELAEEEGTAVLFATHLLREVEDLCDRVIIIQKGEIKAEVSLNGAGQKTEKAVIEVQPAEKAIAWLVGNGYTAERKDGSIVVDIAKENIPELNRSLVGQGLNVFSIMTYTQSLEDEFIKATTAHQEEGEELV